MKNTLAVSALVLLMSMVILVSCAERRSVAVNCYSTPTKEQVNDQ